MLKLNTMRQVNRQEIDAAYLRGKEEGRIEEAGQELEAVIELINNMDFLADNSQNLETYRGALLAMVRDWHKHLY